MVNPNPYTALISVFPDAVHANTQERIELGDMLYRIQSGMYATLIHAVQQTLIEPEKYREQKKRLPAFTPAGIFTRRANVALEISSGVLGYDYDDLAMESIPAIMTQLSHDAAVLYAFRSPSWRGLKIGILCNGYTDALTYTHAWGVGADYLRAQYPALALTEDRACKDISRLCFISHDPDCYIASSPQPLAIPLLVPRNSTHVSSHTETLDSMQVASMLACIQDIDDRERWLAVGMALHSSGESWARSLWDGWSARSGKYDEAGQESAWRYFHNDGKVTMGTVIHLAQEGGWTPLRATFKATSIQGPQESLSSPAADWARSADPSPAVITDLADMLERTYPIQQWLIPGLIPEGFTFLVGSPKSSKTYLAYQLALDIALAQTERRQWLEHYDIQQSGPIIYITLEDDEADSRYRVAELAPWLKQIPRERFMFIHGADIPRFDNGLIPWLETELIQRYRPALLVIDPVSYLYAPMKKNADQYIEVREMLLPLRWLGKTYHCSILGIDHRRKKSNEDVDIFETIMGSNAKVAITDSMLVVVREDTEVTVHARVRKGKDQTLTLLLEFAADGTARWLWKGASDGIIGGAISDLRPKVWTLLQSTAMLFTISDIIAALNLPDTRQVKDQVKTMLLRGYRAGEISRGARGQYSWGGGNTSD